MSNVEFERLRTQALKEKAATPAPAPAPAVAPSLWHVLMMAARVAVENMRRAWANLRAGDRLTEGLDARFLVFQIGAALLLLGMLESIGP